MEFRCSPLIISCCLLWKALPFRCNRCFAIFYLICCNRFRILIFACVKECWAVFHWKQEIWNESSQVLKSYHKLKLLFPSCFVSLASATSAIPIPICLTNSKGLKLQLQSELQTPLLSARKNGGSHFMLLPQVINGWRWLTFHGARWVPKIQGSMSWKKVSLEENLYMMKSTYWRAIFLC